jgi:hypothetical protein
MLPALARDGGSFAHQVARAARRDDDSGWHTLPREEIERQAVELIDQKREEELLGREGRRSPAWESLDGRQRIYRSKRSGTVAVLAGSRGSSYGRHYTIEG